MTNEANSNNPTVPYGNRRQDLISPHSLNEPNLPPNFSKNLETMAIPQKNPRKMERHNNKDSPQLPVPSKTLSLSTPPMTISTVDIRDTTSYLVTFYSDEPRRILLTSHSSPPTPPRTQKRKMSRRMSFKKWECRSISAEPAGKYCRKGRTSPERQGIS